MDPAAMEFVMQPNRTQNDRSPEQSGQLQASPPRCEGQSLATLHNTQTASTSASSLRAAPAYDPVHNGYHATYYRPPPGSYVPNLHHGWNHLSTSTAPRLGGPTGDPLPLPNGAASFRPIIQHVTGGGYASFTSIHNEHSAANGSYFHNRPPAPHLPNPNPAEASFSAASRNLVGQHHDNGLHSLPPLSPIAPSREGGDHRNPPLLQSRAHYPNTDTSTNNAPTGSAAIPSNVTRSDMTAQLRLTRAAPSPNSPPSAMRTAREPANPLYGGWETGWGGMSPLTYSPNRVRPSNNGFSAHMSESSSDEDPEIEPLDGGPAFGYPTDYYATHSGRIRAQQFAQGQPPARRVASTKALTSLEKVEISDLPENERTCVICYNDFDVETPEGNKELPLRLPKCKHVFGDHCIKKWFEENDTCPYCRDKVHSEPQFGHGTSATFQQYMRRHHLHGRLPSQDLTTDSLHLRVRNGAPSSEPHLNPSDINGRRPDGLPAISWSSRSRSPTADTHESRRRARARHGGSRGSPPSSRSISYGINTPYIAYSQPGPNRNYPTANPYRHFGGLPSLSNTLNGYTGEDLPHHLERYMLRPPPSSIVESPAFHGVSNTTLAPQLGSRSRTEVHQIPSSSATPLSPTISGPEINMGTTQ